MFERGAKFLGNGNWGAELEVGEMDFWADGKDVRDVGDIELRDGVVVHGK